VLVPLDLLVSFSPRVREDLSPPAIYQKLRDLPDGIVAEYPIRLGDVAGDYRELFWQDAHGKPILNGFPARSYAESRALALEDPDRPRTAEHLAALGVRYLLVQRRPQLVTPGVFQPGELKSPGYRKIASDSYATLWRVTARPVAALIEPHEGFTGRDEYAHPGRWMNTAVAVMRVRARCIVCAGALMFRAASASIPRELTITGPGGRTLYRGRVGLREQSIRVRARFGRSTDLRFSVSPGPSTDPKTHLMLALLVRSPEIHIKGHQTASSIW